jgi:hypothetical protein
MSRTLSLMPNMVDFEVPRGFGQDFELLFTDVDGNTVDISGDTITIVARDQPGGTQKFTRTATPTDAAHGAALLELQAADLTDDRVGFLTEWVYVITRTHAGKTVPWWAGKIVLADTAK